MHSCIYGVVDAGMFFNPGILFLIFYRCALSTSANKGYASIHGDGKWLCAAHTTETAVTFSVPRREAPPPIPPPPPEGGTELSEDWAVGRPSSVVRCPSSVVRGLLRSVISDGCISFISALHNALAADVYQLPAVICPYIIRPFFPAHQNVSSWPSWVLWNCWSTLLAHLYVSLAWQRLAALHQ